MFPGCWRRTSEPSVYPFAAAFLLPVVPPQLRVSVALHHFSLWMSGRLRGWGDSTLPLAAIHKSPAEREKGRKERKNERKKERKNSLALVFLTAKCFTAVGICHNMPQSPPRAFFTGLLWLPGWQCHTLAPMRKKKRIYFFKASN